MTWNEMLLETEGYLERYRNALKEILDVNCKFVSEDLEKIRSIAQTALDGEPTTADKYNDEEDVQLGASIVKSNENVSGVFMSDGEITSIDYFDDEVQDHGPPYSMANLSGEPVKAHPLAARYNKKGIQDDLEC